jgi:hypothetical protein
MAENEITLAARVHNLELQVAELEGAVARLQNRAGFVSRFVWRIVELKQRYANETATKTS